MTEIPECEQVTVTLSREEWDAVTDSLDAEASECLENAKAYSGRPHERRYLANAAEYQDISRRVREQVGE